MKNDGEIAFQSENGFTQLEPGISGRVLKTSAPDGYVVEWGCGDCRHRGQAYCSEEDCENR